MTSPRSASSAQGKWVAASPGVLATAGWKVLLVDVTEEALEDATKRSGRVSRGGGKGALRGDQAGSAMAIIHPIRHMQRLREAQVVIEAIPEDPVMGPLRAIGTDLRALDPVGEQYLFNFIASLGMVSGQPDRVVGIHFMNPVPVMRLVEVVRAIGTSNRRCARA